MLKQVCILLSCFLLTACAHSSGGFASVEKNVFETRHGFKATVSDDFVYVGEGFDGIPIKGGLSGHGVTADSYVFARITDGDEVGEMLVFSFVTSRGSYRSKYGGSVRYKYVGVENPVEAKLGQYEYVVSYSRESGVDALLLQSPIHICVQNGFWPGCEYYALVFSRPFISSFRTIRYLVPVHEVPEGVDVQSYLFNRFNNLVKI